MNKFIKLILCVVLISCGRSNPDFYIGNEIYPTSQTWASINNDDVYDELARAGRHKDAAKIARMMASGQVTILKTYDRVTIVDVGFDVLHVEFNGIEYIAPKKAFEKNNNITKH